MIAAMVGAAIFCLAMAIATLPTHPARKRAEIDFVTPNPDVPAAGPPSKQVQETAAWLKTAFNL